MKVFWLFLLLAFIFSSVRAEESRPVVSPRSPVPADKLPDEIPVRLTLKMAEQYALAHHPAIKSASFSAAASEQDVLRARAEFFPQLSANIVAAKSSGDDARMAATSGLGNPTILTRESQGLYLTQLITDFGRTALLLSSARFSARSAASRVQAVRSLVLLDVNRAYFGALGAQEMVRLANQEVEANQFLFDRVKALAASDLKSSLDVNLQQANLAQIRLLQIEAKGRLQEAMADLSAAMGSRRQTEFILGDQAELTAPSPLEEFVAHTLTRRPDLIALRFERDAALKQAAARGAARLPVVSAIAAGGLTPAGASNGDLPDQYGMIGVNVSVPLFTGGKLSAQQKEAQLRAKAVQEHLENQETDAIRDVRAAWIEAEISYQRIAVSKEFLDAAGAAFSLAQNLYLAGASSIVEVSQSDLQRVQARMTYIDARYKYLIHLAALAYQAGDLQ